MESLEEGVLSPRPGLCGGYASLPVKVLLGLGKTRPCVPGLEATRSQPTAGQPQDLERVIETLVSPFLGL